MRIKHFAATAAALCCAFALAGCGNAINRNDKIEIPDSENIITTTAATAAKPDEPEQEVRTFEEITVTPKLTEYTEFSKAYNAESTDLNGKAKVSDEREGFKGKGYVTGIAAQSDWELSFDLPAKQYYNISITVAADEIVQNGIAVNGEKISEFTTDGSGEFQTISFNNIMLDKGVNKISIVPENGVLDVDYAEITASEDISKLSQTLKAPTLVNKNADYNAKALYQYICESYGKNVILGQHDTMGTTYETDLIYRTTGKYPAMRFGDLMYVTGKENSEQLENDMTAAENWYSNGGIVGYMWNWTSPSDKDDLDSIYAENTDFDLSKAVTKEKIAAMSLEDIKKLEKDGKVSAECVAVVEDIDKVSEQLARLRDEGIAVLWRPLHEASNGYFWWSKDEESYKWLWKLMYQRQTEYHKLNNLIWVWSAQNARWYVGDDYCDVLSLDVYSSNASKDGQVNSLLFLQGISKNKPIAMSECGTTPDIQSIADEKAMWSYIGQWGGNYLMNEEGKLSEEFNAEADLITMYNNNLTVTRDKLPAFNHLASEIKEAEEKAAAESDNDSSKSETTKSEKSDTSKSTEKTTTTTKKTTEKE
ncbi:MAG: glycosyl hydrolase [Ruminococcus sp.]|nr:glycosyl hydrolase [Ruminococcus sp.]